MMNPLNKFFDKIYCVNLDRRPDRWKEAQMEFNRHGLEVQRMPAVDGTKMDVSNIKMEVLKRESLPGAVGCSLSHRNIVLDAKRHGYSRILALEDDVIFSSDVFSKFEEAIKNLPEDWDMFYLSGNNLRPDRLTQVNEHIWKTKFTFTTHCYGINSKVYDVIIKGIEKLDVPIDQFYVNEMQKNYNCYIIRPHLSWQREGYSDIMKGNRDYKNIRN